MSLISKTVSGLIQGVSQQSPLLRMPNQADLQVNAISSPVLGLGKRPGTYALSDLGVADANAFWHLIDRDQAERYMVAADNTHGLRVWDLNGNAKQVTLVGSAAEYLQCSDPRHDLLMVTANDHTFVLNKTKKVEIRSDIDQEELTLTLGNTVSSSPWWFTYNMQPDPMNYSYLYNDPTVLAQYRVCTQSYAAAKQVAVEDLKSKVRQNWPNAVFIDYMCSSVTNPWRFQAVGPHAVPSKYEGGDPFWAQWPMAPVNVEVRYKNTPEDTDILTISGTLSVFRDDDSRYSDPDVSGTLPVSDLAPIFDYPKTDSNPNFRGAGWVEPSGAASVVSLIKFNLDNEAFSVPSSTSGSAVDNAVVVASAIQTQLPKYTVTRTENKVSIRAYPYPYMKFVNQAGDALTYTKTLIKGESTVEKDPDRVYVVIKSGVAEQTYRVSINGILAEYTTGKTDSASTYKADVIATNLANSLTAGGLTANVYGRLIEVAAPGNADMTFDYFDTWNGQALYAMKNRVQAFTDLPASFVEDRAVEVVGEGGAEGYYVKYTKDGPSKAVDYDTVVDWRYLRFGSKTFTKEVHGTWTATEGSESGIWEECARAYLKNYLSASTMPHVLVRLADGTFEVRPVKWAPRKVGDYDSVPPPSFVDTHIQDLFFWRGRLGLLTDDTVVLSKSAEFYDFWPKTAKEVLDSDPIDITVTSTKVTNLKYAAVFNTSLMLFADNGQYQVSANNVLSPKTVAVQPTLEYASAPGLRAINTGETVLFGVPRGGAMSLWEADVMPGQYLTVASEITMHVPTYVPAGVSQLVSCNTENITTALTGNDGNLFVYQYLWNGDKKAQEAWHNWTFSTTVRFAQFIGSRLYMVMEDGDGCHVEYLETKPFHVEDGMSQQVYLDRRKLVGDSWTGVPYTMRYRLSPIVARDSQGQGLPDVILKLRTIAFDHSQDTGAFRIEVTPEKRSTKSHSLPARRTGSFRVPVLSDGLTVRIELVSESELPCYFQSFVWEAHQVMRAQKL